VNGREHLQNVVVPWQGDVIDWPVASFDDLTEAHFKMLAEMKPSSSFSAAACESGLPKPRSCAVDRRTNRHRNHGHARGVPHLQRAPCRGSNRHRGPAFREDVKHSTLSPFPTGEAVREAARFPYNHGLRPRSATEQNTS